MVSESQECQAFHFTRFEFMASFPLPGRREVQIKQLVNRAMNSSIRFKEKVPQKPVILDSAEEY
jgi:hypothetical protein